MIEFNCSKCGHKLSAPNQFLGKPIKCPKCGEQNTVKTVSAGISRTQKLLLTFALPLTVQGVLTICHLLRALNRIDPDSAVSKTLAVATFLYTAVLLFAGALSATSSSLESFNRKIKEEENTDLQWFRVWLKALRKWIPAYNTSFSTRDRMIKGAVVSTVYIVILAYDGFIATAITTIFSLLLILLGMKIVKDGVQIAREKEKKEEAKRKKAAAEETEILGVAQKFGTGRR